MGGNSLAVQWLRLNTLTAKGPGSIPGQATKIPQATWPKKQNKTLEWEYIVLWLGSSRVLGRENEEMMGGRKTEKSWGWGWELSLTRCIGFYWVVLFPVAIAG